MMHMAYVPAQPRVTVENGQRTVWLDGVKFVCRGNNIIRVPK